MDTKIDKRKNAEPYKKGEKPGPNSEYFGKSYGQLQRESKSARSSKTKAQAKSKAIKAKMAGKKPTKKFDEDKYFEFKQAQRQARKEGKDYID